MIVTADHGFSTISKESRTSPAARIAHDTSAGYLQPGFLAIDLASVLDLPLSDTAGRVIDWRSGRHGAWGDGLLGDPASPQVVVTANGGADLIYLPRGSGRVPLARPIVAALWAQDYTGAVFTRDALGAVPGALPLSAVGLVGSALTPMPDIVVGFRSFDTGCGRPELCAAEVADASLQQGQGIHGTLSRADTHTFMAAIGPDFRSGFVDPAPASNADVGRAFAALPGPDPPSRGRLQGRVLSEVAAATGGLLAPHLADPTRQFVVLTTSYAVWAYSVPAAFGILTRLLLRMASHKLPPASVAASSWLALGPTGTGALGMLVMGADAPTIFGGHGLAAVGAVAQGAGVLAPLLLWGFGLWWLFLAVLITIRYFRAGVPLNLNWWGYTFPLGVYTVATLRLATRLNMSFFAAVGELLATALAVMWVIIMLRALHGALRGHLFVSPCIATAN